MIAGTIFLVLGAQSGGEWRLEDAILPLETPARHTSQWAFAHPLAHLNGRERSVFLAQGEEYYFPTTGGFIDTAIGNIRGASGGESFVFRVSDSVLFVANWWTPQFALVSTPLGILGVHAAVPHQLVYRQMPSGQKVDSIVPEPPNPGEPSQLGFQAFWNAGDVNADGFDEVFFQAIASGGSDGYAGMIDGATHQLLWRDFVPQSGGIYAATPVPDTEFRDLNQDGTADAVAAFFTGPSVIGPFERQVIAYSGLTGARLWEFRAPDPGNDAGFWATDLDQDGGPDVLTYAGEALYALRGVNGAVLWAAHLDDVRPHLPPGAQQERFAHPVFPLRSEGDPEEVVCNVLFDTQGFPVAKWEQRMAHFRASDGSFLRLTELPPSYEPWTDDPIEPREMGVPPGSFYLGDPDRDGYTEFARDEFTPSLDKPGSQGIARGLAIIGPPTLTGPDQLPLASLPTFDVDVPSAGGKLARLLLAAGFAGDDGWTVGGWQTGLADDPLLAWSRQAGITTTLAADGTGSLTFYFPGHPGLVGREVHARAVVEETSGSAAVWTVTSVVTATVVP